MCARGAMSAQWEPGYHGPACQGPLRLTEDLHQVPSCFKPVEARRDFPPQGKSPREGVQDAIPFLLRTWLSKPGESLRACRGLDKDFSLGEESLLERASRQRSGEASSLTKGSFPPQASSVSATERTWDLRFPQSHGRASTLDASAVVTILVYKAVNKAAPSKGGPRLATLVIRGPSDAADEGDVTKGHSKAPAASPHRPGWTVAFSALVTPPLPWTASRVLYFMVHLALWCTSLYRAPGLLLCRHVVSLPAKTFGGMRTRTSIKGGGGLLSKGLLAFGSRVPAIVATPSSASSVTCNLSKQYKPPKAGRRGFTSPRGP